MINFKESPFMALAVIFVGVILIVMTWATISSSGENKRLKTSIKENLIEIERLESQKNTIFESIKRDSLALRTQDEKIQGLEIREDSLINNLNYFKNERIKIKNAYFNGSVSERVRIFSRLATETDSVR